MAVFIATNLIKEPIGSELRIRMGGVIVVLLIKLAIRRRWVMVILLLVGGLLRWLLACYRVAIYNWDCWLNKLRELVIILL